MFETSRSLYTPAYEVELWDINGVFVADVSAIVSDGFTMDIPLNDVESLEFNLDLVQFELMCASIGADPRSILEAYRTDVKIKRDGQYILGTQVVRTQTNLNNAEPSKILVQCTGYLNYFKDRYSTASYTNMTYAQIARQLITDTQDLDYGDFGVTLGVDQASPSQDNTRVRNYDLQSVKDGILNLTKLQNDNFDFEFTADKVFNTYARKGSDLMNVELVYPQNITNISVVRDASTLANYIIGVGSGIGEERLQSTALGVTSAQTYRRRERTELFNSVINQDILNANTFGALEVYQEVEEVPSFTITPNELDIGEVKVGDRIILRIDGSTFINNVNGLYRIMRQNVRVDSIGAETVSLDVVAV